MPIRRLAVAAGLAVALAAPSAGLAADVPSSYVPPPVAYVPPPPPDAGPSGSCGNLQPSDVYVPPQVAYIVACTVELRPTFRHYGNPKWYEGKLVYFDGWANRRPAVHLLAVPR